MTINRVNTSGTYSLFSLVNIAKPQNISSERCFSCNCESFLSRMFCCMYVVSKATSFIVSPQAIITNNELAVAGSTSIIVVKKIYFTVVLCVYIIVLDLFYTERLFTNLFSFHFQTKDGNMCAPAWSPNDGTTNFWVPFLL